MKQVEIDFEYLSNLTALLSKIQFAGATIPSVANCTVAGGAIRDMLLQKPISDIDVFYEGELQDSKLSNWFTIQQQPSFDYPDGFSVTHVVKWKELPVPIQLIQVKDVKKHIESFPSEQIRVYFSLKSGLGGVTPDFVWNATDKVFIWDDKVDLKYFNKIKAKYSDWKHQFVNEEDSPLFEEVEPF